MDAIAASVEGAFVIIDRATPALRKMRLEAERTDRAMSKLGDRMDGVGTPAQGRQYERTERALRNVERAGGDAETGLRRAGRGMDDVDRKSRNLTTRLGRLGAAFKGVVALLAPGKWVAMGSAIGVALQAVRALSAGAVALTPRIADLAGVAGALPATFTGIGLAVGSVKLAFNDLGKAMGGNRKALQALTPEGRQFLDTLKAQHKVIQQLRSSAQRGLFPGLDQAIHRAHRAVPLAGNLLQSAGAAVGDQANGLVDMLTGRGRLGDLQTLGSQGVSIIGNLGRSVRNLAAAALDFAVSARPFTNWLADTVEGWTSWARESSRARRESGQWQQFFGRTRQSLENFGHIVQNLWTTFRNLGHASRALGDDLYGSFEQATKRWADWTGSLRGQNELRRWFDDAREPLHELFGLVGDLGKAMANFDMTGLTGTAHALRGAVPGVQRLFEALARLGPDLGAAIGSFGDLLANLSGSAGPVTLLLRSFTGIVSAVNTLLQTIPALGTALSAVITAGGLMKLASIVGLGRFVGARGAGAATTAAGAAVAGRGAGVLAGVRGAAGYTTGTYGLARSFGYGRMASAAAAGGGMLGNGLLAAGRFLGPMAMFGGALGAMQGDGGAGLKGRWRNAVSGATFGILGNTQQRLTGDQKRIDEMVGGAPSSIGGARAQIAHLRAIHINDGPFVTDHDQLQSYVRQEIRARQQLIGQLEREKRVRGRDRGLTRAGQIQQAYQTDRSHGGQVSAFHHLVENVQSAMPSTLTSQNAPGARAIAANTLAMVKAAAGNNPRLVAEYKRLRQGIAREFDAVGLHVSSVNDRIYSGTRSEWARIRDALANPAEQAAERATTAFTSIERQAIGSLEAMGLSPAAAKRLVRGASGQGGGAVERSRSNQYTAPSFMPTSTGSATSSFGGNALGSGNPFSPSFTVGGGTGDGPGDDRQGAKRALRTTAASGGNASLMGASSDLAPYAQDAAAFGLHVSSGLRPGATTVSGNVSYHSSGRALDFAGPPAQMMAFAKHASRTYGGQLEELIHTPLGTGQVKDGRPYVYTGAVAAQHHDHVHVADAQSPATESWTGPGSRGGSMMNLAGAGALGGPRQIGALRAPRSSNTGLPGVLQDVASAAMAAGLTQSVNDRLAAAGGQGFGGGGVMTATQVARLAESVGLPGVTFAEIARGESGYNPRAVGHDPGGTMGLGLWQITTKYNDDIIKRFGGRAAMLNPETNAEAAKAIYDRAGLGAWYGTRYLTDRNKHFTGDGDGIPWFGDGADFVAKKPMVIGVGDRHERVSITPTRKSVGLPGGHKIEIGRVVINNHRPGDIREQMRRELEEAFDEFAASMAGGVEDDGELLE